MNEPTNENEFLPPYAHADAPETQEREEFRIDSENAANWYLRKLANIEAEKRRVTQQAAEILRQLDADAENLRFLYDADLQEWTRQELARKGGKRKSLALLQGTACFRSVSASLKISDPAAALVHVIAIGADAIKRSIHLDAEKYRALAEAALKDGELLPGVETVPARESFSVKFGGKD